MKIRFLGTGAADWYAVDERGEYRRLTSTLFDDTLLIDFSYTAMDALPESASVKHILITHSHEDHFDPKAIASLAPAVLYAHESWASEISIPGIDVVPVKVGQWTQAGEYEVLPMPSNHSTARLHEQTLHYVLKKGDQLFLYATDGAWFLNKELKLMKDMHLCGMAIDTTIGDGHEGDFRVFEHNSLPMIRIMVDTMHKTGLLNADAPIFLTHMARTLHGTQKELESSLTPPYIACYDGFEAEI